MDVFTFVIIVVIIGCGSGVVNNYLKNQREMTQYSAEDEEVNQELALLRERIEVLEKIITDEKYQLERDLNRLERQA